MTGPLGPRLPPPGTNPIHVPEPVHELLHDVAVAIVPILLAWLAKLLMPRK